MKQNHYGYTLIEAIMVMAVMAAIVITVPPIIQWMRHQGVGHAAEQLQVDLQLARMMAISKKQTCTVRFNDPGPDQYTNMLNNQYSDLSAYRGGVHFIARGPDGDMMAEEISFNRRGMSTTVVPLNVFLCGQDRLNLYRIQVVLPGGISVYRWNGRQWQ